MGRFKWQSKVTLAALLLSAITIGIVYLLPQQQAKGKTLALPLSYEFLPSDLLINFEARPVLLPGNKVPRWLMCSDEENRPLGDGGSSWASKLLLITGGHHLLFIEFSPRIDEGDAVVTEISVFLNETRCRTSQVAEHLGLFRVEVPAGTVHAGNNTVEIHAPINARLRPQRLALLRDPDAPFESLDWSSPVKVAAGTGHLVVQREGRVILPFMAPPGAHSFACDLDVEDYGNRGEATCRLMLDRPFGGINDFTNRERIARILGRKGLPVELGLDDSGEHAFILDIESLSPDAALTISRSRLMVDPQSEEQTMTDPNPPRKASPNTNSRHPDVIVIILDAARTDHFEAFGYPRATTPFLARLAEESLLFDNVYAQAPYTVCSVPTMMTGLSFATHGAVGKGSHRLSDSETTLAEHLGEVGYQTVGISSTPKHSTASGANQGYDEFHEVWGRVKKLALDPAPLVKQAEATLRAADRNRPLFMMLHMLPPHAPYQPPNEHDIFGRPGHERSDTDSIEFIQSIERGEWVPSDEELGDLVALYDGNLRWVDKAVESVVNVLRETRDWNNTLLVVVSDHGEAFLEHGMLQHSTTLYNEMLRVPLILRLPAEAKPEWVDTSRLVSLQDLTPTLLGVVGKSCGPRVTGHDLLSRDYDAVRDRIVFRTAGDTPDFGLLAGRWKVIVHPDGTRELYDLETDPTETHDLSMKEPTRISMLAMILADELKAAPRPLDQTEAEALSREELQFLQKLGYIE